MIYVDEAIWTKGKSGKKKYAHMVADSLEELHSFALDIGVKKHFFHRSKFLHYDISVEQRDLALSRSAKEVSTRDIISICKKNNLTPV